MKEKITLDLTYKNRKSEHFMFTDPDSGKPVYILPDHGQVKIVFIVPAGMGSTKIIEILRQRNITGELFLMGNAVWRKVADQTATPVLLFPVDKYSIPVDN